MSRPVASRVALVHDWLTGMRGGEKVLERLAELFPEAPIHTLFHLPGSVSAALEAHPIRTSFLQRAPGLARHYRHYLPLFPAAVEQLDLTGADLVVSTSHCVAKGVLPPPGAVHVCYCHTPMRYAWDQERAYFPRRTGPVALARALVLSALRVWDVAASTRVDRFLANSSFVAERIRRYYGREADVVPPPVETGFFTPGEASSRGYALMVSALAPYKKVEVAIAACSRAGLPLKVVGTGPERERLERSAGAGAELLGSISADRLRDLYRGARMVLQPGIEDFGIATVEALACGAPMVALRAGGVLDIVEHGAHGLLYESGEDDQVGALAASIDKACRIEFNLMDLRRRAELFSAERFTERMRAILAAAAPSRQALDA